MEGEREGWREGRRERERENAKFRQLSETKHGAGAEKRED